MRISEVAIDGFGPFSSARFALSPGLTIIHGPNEAGKSALLAFIRGTLYGHAPARGETKYPPIYGGRHGGRVIINDGSDNLQVDREFGRRPPVILINGTRPGTQSDLDRFLGNTDEKLFRSVFAFSLTELQNFDTLTSGGAADLIFDAGISGAGRPARSAIAELDRRLETLLRPRSISIIPELATTLDELEQRIQAAREHAMRHAGIVAEEERVHEELLKNRQEEHEANARERRYERLLQAWPAWQQFTSTTLALERLPAAPEMPAEAERQLQARLDALHHATGNLEDIDNEIRERESERNALAPDPMIEAISDRVEALRDTVEVQRERILNRTRLQNEVEETRAAITHSCRRLGPQWNPEKAAQHDASIPQLETLRSHQDQLRETERAYRETKAHAEQMKQTAREKAAIVEEAVTKLSPQAPPAYQEIELRERALRRLRHQLDELARAESEARLREELTTGPATGSSASTSRRLEAGLAGLALVVAAAAMWQFIVGEIATSAVLGGVAIVLGGLYLSARPRHKPATTPRATIPPTETATETTLQRLRNSVREIAQEAGCAQPPTLARLDAAEVENQKHRQERVEYDQQREALELARAAASRAATESEKASEAAAAAEAALAREHESWQALLASHDFPAHVSVQGAIDLFDELQQTQALILHARGLEARLASIGSDILAWETEVTEVVEALDLQLHDRSIDGLAAEIRSLERRRAEAVSTRVRIEAAEEIIQRAQQKRQNVLADLQRAGEQLVELLQKYGADDADDYLRKWEIHVQRAALVQDRDVAQTSLITILGTDQAARSERSTLEEGAVSSWQEERELARRNVTALRETQERLAREHQDLRRQREALEAAADVQTLELEYQSVHQEFIDRVEEFRCLKAARELLVETLERFKRERQPSVLAHASQVMSEATGGRFTRVLQDEDGTSLRVVDSTGAMRVITELSRGTMELLYVAVRLGLARDYAERHTALPLVLDDILVNLDPERAGELARVLVQEATQRQIVLLTCHPSTVDLLVDASTSAQPLILEIPRRPLEASTQVRTVVVHTDEHASPVREAVLQALSSGPQPLGAVAGAVGLDSREVRRELERLRRLGAVSSQGHGRGATWQLAQPPELEEDNQ